MATVMKIQLNMKINRDLNASTSFEHIIDTEEEAKALGAQDKLLFDAWIAGYGSQG